MKYCMQCGTAATDYETKCENCDFEHFHEPHPAPRSVRLAALEAFAHDMLYLSRGAEREHMTAKEICDTIRARFEKLSEEK